MLLSTNTLNGEYWGFTSKNTVRNVSILLSLVCIGLLTILFFLEPTDSETSQSCVDLRVDLETNVVLQIGALVTLIIGLWSYIWAPLGELSKSKMLVWMVIYIFLALAELGCLFFMSSFIDSGYMEDDGVIAIWKDCGTNGSFGYGLYIFFAFYIFFVLAFMLCNVCFRLKIFFSTLVLYFKLQSAKKKNDDYGSGGNVASASLV